MVPSFYLHKELSSYKYVPTEGASSSKATVSNTTIDMAWLASTHYFPLVKVIKSIEG